MRSKYPPLVPVEGIGGGSGSSFPKARVLEATAMDKVRRYVFAVRRAILSMTSRFLVLMLLDLCFAGLPTTKLVTADEGLHPSRRRVTSSFSNAKLGAAVAKN